MARAHRASHDGMWVNPEHTDHPAARTERVKPEEFPEKGVNFPYRGTELHGVSYPYAIPDEYEGSPDKTGELVMPPHYAPHPERIEAVPVRVVQEERRRLAWMADKFYIGSTEPASQIVGRNDQRKKVRISVEQTSGTYPFGAVIHLSPSPEVNRNAGYRLVGGADVWFETTEPIYAIASAGNEGYVDVLWEYWQYY